jgi:LPPG:FO 2-phospho-L-lactate transferase
MRPAALFATRRPVKIVLLAGGLGGARLAPALADAIGARSLTVIANVGDDLDWMGLRVCPDLDSIAYALAGLWDRRRGWGRRSESFRLRDALSRFGASWFSVGDRDLALHLTRAAHLESGKSLTAATEALVRRLGVRGVRLLPASDALTAGTRLALCDGRTVPFQQWYVRELAWAPVRRAILARAPASRSALAALREADAVVLGPSNPIASLGAILALRGMRQAVVAAPRRLAVSPVVVGRTVRGTGLEHHARARRRLLATVGARDGPASIARLYRGLAEQFLLDGRDRSEAAGVRRAGLEPVVADLLDERRLAAAIVKWARER